MTRQFVPADATVTALEKQARDLEEKALAEQVPNVNRLLQDAQLCREWVKVLRSGWWTS